MVVDDVKAAEDAARHASLVSITEKSGTMELRFNNGVALVLRAYGEGFMVIEHKEWRA